MSTGRAASRCAEHFVAQALVDVAHGATGRLGKGVEAEDKLPAALRGQTLPGGNGAGHAVQLLLSAGDVGCAPDLKVIQTGGHRGKRIRFGHETAAE